MATTTTFQNTIASQRARGFHLRDALLLLVFVGLPLGAFGLVNLGAEALGIMPFFFAPFGLPGWMGAVLHLAQLALLGMAIRAVHQRDPGHGALAWLVAFTIAYIALPFITPPLDSFGLSLVCSALFLLGLAAAIRAGAVTPLAGIAIAPVLAILGFSAIMGLTITLAFTPPFALMQGQQPAASA